MNPIINNSINTSKQIAESFKSAALSTFGKNQIDNEAFELQELVNKAIAKGETETAQSLLALLERRRKK
ncbi:MAG: hypothetical protein EOM29_08555 [Bacteroidia bacterium]|nr:hypothetical protein [Bacteroidia bacterium]